jgi:hypothetical protein
LDSQPPWLPTENEQFETQQYAQTENFEPKPIDAEQQSFKSQTSLSNAPPNNFNSHPSNTMSQSGLTHPFSSPPPSSPSDNAIDYNIQRIKNFLNPIKNPIRPSNPNQTFPKDNQIILQDKNRIFYNYQANSPKSDNKENENFPGL